MVEKTNVGMAVFISTCGFGSDGGAAALLSACSFVFPCLEVLFSHSSTLCDLLQGPPRTQCRCVGHLVVSKLCSFEVLLCNFQIIDNTVYATR